MATKITKEKLLNFIRIERWQLISLLLRCDDSMIVA